MLFQAWTLSRIVQAADDLSQHFAGCRFDFIGLLDLDRDTVDKLVARLERGLEVSSRDEDAVRAVTIEGIVGAIERMCEYYGRKRAVLLLDDAALTLTPEYLVEFFDIVRILKRPRISPKASVYPGSTEYGPRFHAIHEGRIVTAWLPVEHDGYREVMRRIAQQRYRKAAPCPTTFGTC